MLSWRWLLLYHTVRFSVDPDLHVMGVVVMLFSRGCHAPVMWCHREAFKRGGSRAVVGTVQEVEEGSAGVGESILLKNWVDFLVRPNIPSTAPPNLTDR